MEIIKRVRDIVRNGMNVPNPMYDTIIWKAANFVIKQQIEGDYLEFGVYRGESFIRAYHTFRNVFFAEIEQKTIRTEKEISAIKTLWSKMRFFAFDSFMGLPQCGGTDRDWAVFQPGKYMCEEKKFRGNLRRSKVDMSKTEVVAGWFDDTLTEFTRRTKNLSRASIVHIDSDLYSSAIVALQFIEPLLTDGTVIIFDDWFFFRGNPGMGEQKAFYEWKKGLQGWSFTEYQKEGAFRMSFIANKL